MIRIANRDAMSRYGTATIETVWRIDKSVTAIVTCRESLNRVATLTIKPGAMQIYREIRARARRESRREIGRSDGKQMQTAFVSEALSRLSALDCYRYREQRADTAGGYS